MAQGPPYMGGPGAPFKKIRAAAGESTELLERGGPNFFPIAGGPRAPLKIRGPWAPSLSGGPGSPPGKALNYQIFYIKSIFLYKKGPLSLIHI